MLQYALLLAFPIAMAYAAATDLLTLTIPNRVCVAIMVAFFVVAPFAGLTWQAFFTHLAVGAAVLVFSIALFSFNLIGGGDAKLLAAAALWMGSEQFLPYLSLVALCGGVLALAILAYRRLALPQFLIRHQWAMRLHDSKTGIPYGLALAAAALWIYPSTKWFAGLAA